VRHSFTIAHTWDGEAIEEHEKVHVELYPLDDGGLEIELSAPFHRDPEPPGDQGPFWGLWDYEVVEVFLVGENGRYLEAEFGPHGHHLLLKLDGPRDIVERELPLTYHAAISGERWKGRARISRAYIPESVVRLNLYSIHGPAEDRRYLAWSPVPGTEPDFHQPSLFPSYQLFEEL
jgi:hypothetical protein